MITTLLIYPPQGDPTQPYIALPTLVSYLRKKGYPVKQYDMNIAVYNYYLTRNRINLSLERVRNINCEQNNILLQRKYICEIIGDDVADIIDSAVGALKNINTYNNPDVYKWATRTIENALYILSTEFYPSQWGLFSFKTKNKEDNANDVFRAVCDDMCNPFVEYYKTFIIEDNIGKTDLIGLSITYSDQLIPGLVLAKIIKSCFPKIKIVIGGQYITQIAKEFVVSDLFNAFVDYVIINEGETALVKLIDALNGQGDIQSVPHLYILKPNGFYFSAVYHTEDINDIDPPDYSDIDLTSYYTPYPVILLSPSRGCYWGKCGFCNVSPTMKTSYRERSVEKCIEDIKIIIDKCKTSNIVFSVDAISPSYIRTLSEKLIENNINIHWATQLRMEPNFKEDEFCAIIRKAGCELIFWGMESASSKLLKKMRKGTNVDIFSQILEKIHQVGIKSHIACIVGYPGETCDDFNETLNFININKESIYTVGVSEFKLDKGSYIYKHTNEFGVNADTIIENHWGPIVGYGVESGFTAKDAKVYTTKARNALHDMFANYVTGGISSHSIIVAQLFDGVNNNLFKKNLIGVYRFSPALKFNKIIEEQNGGYLWNPNTSTIIKLTNAQYNIVKDVYNSNDDIYINNENIKTIFGWLAKESFLIKNT